MTIGLCISSLILMSMSVLHSDMVSEDSLLQMKNDITKDLNGLSLSHISPIVIKGANPDSDRNKFLAGTYSFYTKNYPIYVIVSSLSQMEFGNHFGRVINELACAFKSRLHAIVINRKFDNLFHDENADAGLKLLEQLCRVHMHSHPVKKLRNAKITVRRECNCEMYCWEDSKAPWIDFIVPLRDILNKGLTADLFTAPVQSSRSYEEISQNIPIASAVTITTSSVTHTTSIIRDTTLDMVPSIAIQFRCSDNFRHNMGLLPFRGIMDRIDDNWKDIVTKKRDRMAAAAAAAAASTTTSAADTVASISHKLHIYIMTEHPARLSGAPLSAICPPLISRLQKELSVRYKDTVVSVQRGMMFQTWYQFLNADLVICSASSFCLWPALGNRHGHVYLPMTTLFANKTAVDFGVDNVQFIKDYELFGVDARTMNSSYVINVLSAGNKKREHEIK
jgi:hypothetical protein